MGAGYVLVAKNRGGSPAAKRRRIPVSRRVDAAHSQTERALRESEQRYRAVFECAGDAIFVIRKDRVVDCNRKALKMFRTTRSEILQDLDSLMIRGHDDVEKARARGYDFVRRALAGEAVEFEWSSSRWDATRFETDVTLTRAKIAGEVCVLGLVRDITERRRTEEALSRLSAELLQLQDEERRRIARELHDSTGQNLGALQINLSLIARTAGELAPRARKALDESLALAKVSLREIRTLSYLLHPPLLEELGLVPALRAYADGYAERTGVRVDLDLPPRMKRLPPDIETALFRIVQEGITNIHRHSGSRTAVLRLKVDANSVILHLIDHGTGRPRGSLDPSKPDTPHLGVGIAGMRERVRQLGGQFNITSGRGGTTLHVVLPIRRKATSATA